MSDWNFDELRELCKAKNRIYPREFIDSLYWKKIRAEIHAKEGMRVWRELFEGGQFILGDEKYSKAHLIYSAHAECCAHCLRSMVDLLMQIINSVILNGQIPEGDVKFWKIYESLKEKDGNIYGNLIESMKLLEKDESFEYLSAFSNVNKHRKLIQCDFNAEYGENCRNKHDIVFHGFTYNDKEYSRMWGSDITEKYRTNIITLICNIGQYINDFVRDIDTC